MITMVMIMVLGGGDDLIDRDILGRKYTPTLGEHVIMVLKTEYPGLQVEEETVKDSRSSTGRRPTGRIKITLPCNTDVYDLVLAAEGKKTTIKMFLAGQIVLYWGQTGLTIEHFAFELKPLPLRLNDNDHKSGADDPRGTGIQLR